MTFYRIKAAFLLMVPVLSFFGARDLPAQERARLTLSYEKLYNSDKKLSIELVSGKGKKMVKIDGASIHLAVAANDSVRDLADLKTDREGQAELLVIKGYRFLADKDGFSTFTASYEGTDHYRGSTAEIIVRDLDIRVDPEVVDSVKTVNVSAYETDPQGNRVPVEGLEISVGVERLFSTLQIGQVQTDKEGNGKIGFPNDLPGDSTGILNITARVEGNEYYGSVGTRKAMSWGLPVSYVVRPLPRKLWSNEAPVWMIVSVFLVLSGAWLHFGLAIFRIARIKKAAWDLEELE